MHLNLEAPVEKGKFVLRRLCSTPLSSSLSFRFLPLDKLCCDLLELIVQ